jgi:murein DD-endopeptidase MepM/ murein hydrolase activator NlpD
MRLPVNDYRISSHYGKRILNGKEQFHDGIDFVSKKDDRRVFAIADGLINYDKDNYDHSKRWIIGGHHTAGNMVIQQFVTSGNPYYVRYLHLLDNTVKNGQLIHEGDLIGTYADVGISYGAHLHVDLYDAGWKIVNIEAKFQDWGIL